MLNLLILIALGLFIFLMIAVYATVICILTNAVLRYIHRKIKENERRDT